MLIPVKITEGRSCATAQEPWWRHLNQCLNTPYGYYESRNRGARALLFLFMYLAFVMEWVLVGMNLLNQRSTCIGKKVNSRIEVNIASQGSMCQKPTYQTVQTTGDQPASPAELILLRFSVISIV